MIRARKSLIDFIVEICEDQNREYLINWHHDEICYQLEKILTHKKIRQMIWVPPQYGKSEIVSRFLPAWILGNDPTKKIILSSYSASLAESFNIDTQRIIDTEAYRKIFPETQFSRKNVRQSLTKEGGYLYAIGVGGTTTGKRADVFICDDPVKDLKDALSATQRKAKIDWFNSVAQTRCSLNAAIIVMHTRWHQEDLAGYLIQKSKTEEKASKYDVICFPAAYDPNHEFASPLDHRTKKGEALWPEFKGDQEELEVIKTDVGSYTWGALFQQSPKVEGGNIIKDEWISYYNTLPHDDKNKAHYIGSWDLTFKETGTSYVVGLVMKKQGANFYIVDIVRGKFDFVETAKQLEAMVRRNPDCRQWLIEKAANGEAILAFLKNRVSGLKGIKPTVSKDERLHSVVPFFEAGNVHIPANHPLTKTIVEELTTFPNASNDDIVDAVSMALNNFTKLSGLRHLRAGVKL